MNNKGADQTARMRRLICTFVVRIWLKQVFSWRGLYNIFVDFWMSCSIIKSAKLNVRPRKAQISFGICPVCSKPSLWAQWIAKDPSFLHADSEVSVQTGLVGHTGHFWGLSCSSSNPSFLHAQADLSLCWAHRSFFGGLSCWCSNGVLHFFQDSWNDQRDSKNSLLNLHWSIRVDAMSQLMRLWYLSYRRPAKSPASVHICAVSPEPLLFAHMRYRSRRRVRLKIRHLVPLDGCACGFEKWVYGGWKVPKSHDIEDTYHSQKPTKNIWAKQN